MPENELETKPVAPPVEEDEEERRRKERMDEDIIEGHLEKLYKAIGELTEATKAIATYIKSSEDTTRGLVEAVKAEIVGIKDEVKKLAAGFDEATSAHKKQDKFPTSGKPKASETAEEVTYSPQGLRERGAEMLEKSRQEIVKSVVAPRPTTANLEAGVGKKDSMSEIVKGILSGSIRPGEIPHKIREVMNA